MATFCVNLQLDPLSGMNTVHNLDVCEPHAQPDFENQHALEGDSWDTAVREANSLGLKPAKCTCSGCKGSY